MWNDPLPLIEKGKYFEYDKKPIWQKKKCQYKISNKSKVKYCNHPYDAIGWHDEMADKQKHQHKDIDKDRLIDITSHIKDDHAYNCMFANKNELNHNISNNHPMNNSHANGNCSYNNHYSNNSGVINSHKCYLDKRQKNCELCGINLEKDYHYYPLNLHSMTIVFPINICNKEEIQGITIANLKKPANLQEMREYLLYNMGNKYNSLNDNYKKRGVISKRLRKLLTNRLIRNIDDEDILKFDSNFESGNLMQINFVHSYEYDLYLNVDSNTHGNTQWFFFSVAIDQLPTKKVIFNIKNCYKSESLFNDGMKIMIYSFKDNELNENAGWDYGGENITYTRNNLKRECLIYVNSDKSKMQRDFNHDDSEDDAEDEFNKIAIKVQSNDFSLDNEASKTSEAGAGGRAEGVSGTGERGLTKRDQSFTFSNSTGTNNKNDISMSPRKRSISRTGKKSGMLLNVSGNETTNSNMVQQGVGVVGAGTGAGGGNHQHTHTHHSHMYNQQQQLVKRKKFNYYTLSFSYTFKHEYDKVLFAYCMPYTFTDMITCLRNLEHILRKSMNTSNVNTGDEANKTSTDLSNQKIQDDNDLNYSSFETIIINTPDIYYKRESLCHTLAGLPLYMITITSNSNITKNNGAKLKRRKGVFITARVHPGEANSSFVIQGILKYLLGNTEQAKSLRSFFVFKIVPMLNPDGVAFGNNRTSLSGYDLNRRWQEPDEKLLPTVYYTKQAIANFKKEREILIFCDLHGHSKKKNSFIYGCNTAADGGFCSWTKVRLFPRIFARRSHMFALNDCTFRVTPDKLGTARVVIWKEFKVTNSFTLETSFYGYDYGDKVHHFTPESLEKLGIDFLLSVLEYIYILADLTKELFLTNGWLKPSKLIELTGKPASELLAQRLKEEKEEERRRLRMEKLISEKKEILHKKKMKHLDVPNLPTNVAYTTNTTNTTTVCNLTTTTTTTTTTTNNTTHNTQQILIQTSNHSTSMESPIKRTSSNQTMVLIPKITNTNNTSNRQDKFNITSTNNTSQLTNHHASEKEIGIEHGCITRQGKDMSYQNKNLGSGINDMMNSEVNGNLSIDDQDEYLPTTQTEINDENKSLNNTLANGYEYEEMSTEQNNNNNNIKGDFSIGNSEGEEEREASSQFTPAKVETKEMKYIESVVLKEPTAKQLLPEIKDEWRDYFDIDELQKNYALIMEGHDPNQFEDLEPESDSDPSDETADKETLRRLLFKETNDIRNNKLEEKGIKSKRIISKKVSKRIKGDNNSPQKIDRDKNLDNSFQQHIKTKIREKSNTKFRLASPSTANENHRIIKFENPTISEEDANNKSIGMLSNSNFTSNTVENLKPARNLVYDTDIKTGKNKIVFGGEKQIHQNENNAVALIKSYEGKYQFPSRWEDLAREPNHGQPDLWIKSLQKPPLIPSIKKKDNNNMMNINAIAKIESPNLTSNNHGINGISNTNGEYQFGREKSPYLKALTIQDVLLSKNNSNLLAKAGINFSPFDINCLNNFDKGRSKFRGQNGKESIWISPLELKNIHYKYDETLRKHRLLNKYNDSSILVSKNLNLTEFIPRDNHHDYYNNKTNLKDHSKESNKDYSNILDYEDDLSIPIPNANVLFPPPNIKKKAIYQRKLKDNHLKPLTTFMDHQNEEKLKNFGPQIVEKLKNNMILMNKKSNNKL